MAKRGPFAPEHLGGVPFPEHACCPACGTPPAEDVVERGARQWRTRRPMHRIWIRVVWYCEGCSQRVVLKVERSRYRDRHSS